MANQTGGPSAGNKRKRGAADQDSARESKLQNTNTNGEHDPNSYGILLQGDGILADDNTRTAQAALAAPGMNYPEPSPNQADTGLSFAFDDPGPTVGSLTTQTQLGGNGNNNAANQGDKPAVGSTAWHQQRKDNHKEVERRRREVINEGIENIAKIVPATEKNKGAILQRTFEYIQELTKEREKFNNERATFDITLNELTSRLDRMKESARTAWAETSKWQGRCREAGLPFDDYDDGRLEGLEEDDIKS